MKNLDFDIKLCEYQSLMLKYAVSLTHNYNDALDIVQDVNYQILKNRDKFESQQYTLDISFVFVRNRFISLTRKSRILYIEQETVCNDQIENNTIFYDYGKHSVNHVFSSPTSIINFTSKKPSYDDTRRSGRDNELLQRAQNDL